MCDELNEPDVDSLPLPTGWAESTRSAVLSIVALLRVATLAAREFLIQEGDLLHARRAA